MEFVRPGIENAQFNVDGFRRLNTKIGYPNSASTNSMLTDWYQITMVYGYWKAGMQNKRAVFDLYFRKCPFKGAFTVLAGTSEAVSFVNSFSYRDVDVAYIQEQMPHAEPEFFSYLRTLDASAVKLYGIADGTVVFPNYPCLRIEGPLAVVQLMETTLLNIMNFASLIATNTSRMRLAIGLDSPCQILEFGARRAQGPDGAMSASRYSYLGGADGTSNVRAGQIHGIPISGTHAHAFITAFSSLSDLKSRSLNVPSLNINCEDFVDRVLAVKAKWTQSMPTLMNEGELAAFISYAQAFPLGFLCLIDTYETLKSGLRNFLCVAVVLKQLGIAPKGVRLDSGDLAYLSKGCRKLYKQVGEEFGFPGLEKEMKIVASNDINETILHSLVEEGHEIDTFGIGTHLVTCQAQPALGMVFKLAELEGIPAMKLSQDIAKTSVPARKDVYRLFNAEGEPMLDLVQASDMDAYDYIRRYEEAHSDVGGDETPTHPKPAKSFFMQNNVDNEIRMIPIADRTPTKAPIPGERIFCRSLSDEHKRCFVRPVRVESLLQLMFDCGEVPEGRNVPNTLKEARERTLQQLRTLRSDHLRVVNPTPYKVAATQEFFSFFHEMWQHTAPIHELS